MCYLFNVVKHWRVFTELLHKHANVRITRWKLDFLATKFSIYQTVTRIGVLLHHKSVCPKLYKSE